MIGSQKFDPARSCVVLVVTEAHDRTMMTNETKTTMGSRTGFPKTNDQHHVQVRAPQLFEETATLLFACLSYKWNSHNSHNLAIRSLLIAQQLRRRDNNIHQLHQASTLPLHL
jgi:hypothetical protein